MAVHMAGIDPTVTEKGLSRPMRVLHIGNIANNAYLNARILNERGFDCDVLCYDYYHIMGCPEWEDADFTGAVDEFKPDWTRVDLKGFRRPEWFSQGPFLYAVSYLLARREGRGSVAKWWWGLMDLYRRKGEEVQFSTKGPITAVFRVIDLFLHLRKMGKNAFGYLVAVAGKRLLMLTGMNRFHDAVQTLYRKVRFDILGKKQQHTENHLKQDFDHLTRILFQLFPDQTDNLDWDDFRRHQHSLIPLNRLFAHYDVIHAYGTEPRWPMLTEFHPYVAFEHATIRHLPFQDSMLGRLTALGYHMADEVIITNCDSNTDAEKLKVAKYGFVPHPVNERWISDCSGREIREHLCRELDADFILFNPSRQHWWPHREMDKLPAEIDPAWLKGNDILIEALARFIREVNPKAAAVLVDWGQKVDDTKGLAKDLGIADRIEWIAPQPCAPMLRYIDACDILVDQFIVGAFGSTMPKAMQIGKPAMCHVDPKLHEWCLPEMPPILNAKTVDEVFDALVWAYQNPNELEDLGLRGQEWYNKYHSNGRIQRDLSAIYQRVYYRHHRSKG